MRKLYIIYIFLFLIFSSCSNEEIGDIDDKKEEQIEILENGISNICTTWGMTPEQLKSDMQKYSLIKEDVGYLQFKDKEASLTFAYKFDDTGLISSAIIVPAISNKETKSKILSDYTYIGNKTDVSVFCSQENNTFCLNYDFSLKSKKYSVLGFSPIETSSKFLKDLEAVSVTTNNVSDLDGGSVTLHGTLSGAIKEYGFIYGRTNSLSESNGTKIVSSMLTNGTFKSTINNLSVSTTYYYRTYAVIQNICLYGDVKSFTTNDVSGTVDGHDFIDMGLSVMWATCNIGARKSEDYGYYYAFGETSPKATYQWSNYKYCKSVDVTIGTTVYPLTKYCLRSSDGTVDNKIILEHGDDAASVNWGGKWRMPTKEERDELYDKCDWSTKNINGIKGVEFISKINGNTIFFPFTGNYFMGSTLQLAGTDGYYWTSSVNNIGDMAYSFCVYDKGAYTGSDIRCCGLSVRAVCSR